MADQDQGNTDEADRDGIDWVTCAEDGCTGIRLADTEDSKGSRLYPDCESGVRCWAHAKEADVETALRHVSEHGNLDARGVTVTSELLQRLLSAAPKNDDGHPVLSEARFDHATLQGEARFDNTVTGRAWFRHATFSGTSSFESAVLQPGTTFSGATFHRGARFDKATFQDSSWFPDLSFLESTFHHRASFNGAKFEGDVEFHRTTFHSHARFSGTDFHGNPSFEDATFTGPASFENATFTKGAVFLNAAFEGAVGFQWTTFGDEATFDRATFTGHASFTKAAFQASAWFDRTAFEGPIHFGRVTFTGPAHFSRTTFRGISRFEGVAFHDIAVFQDATFDESTTFEEAVFQADVSFYEAAFYGPADFGNCEFHGRARFTDVAFHGDAKFYSVAFEGDVELPESPFRRNATIHGATFRGNAEFVNATFYSSAELNGVEFHRTPEFVGAVFQGEAWFESATFYRDAELGRTTFHEDARFRRVTFQGSARFDDAQFEGQVDFGQATFKGAARFSRATFGQDASFDRATFSGPVVLFNRTAFERSVSFHRAAIKDATFDQAVVGRDARFRHTVFEGVKQLGPMLVGRNLVLDHAQFQERVGLDVSAATLCARRARFLAGGHLRVRWADIVLDDAELAHTSILSGEPSPFPEIDEGRWARALERLRGVQRVRRDPGRPRLMSLQRADVAGLTVAGVDLRACRFVGAHNLDQLRVQESEYSLPPEGRRLVRRHMIAEEHHWRAQSSKTGRPSRWRSAWRRSRGQDNTRSPADDAGRSSTEDSRVPPDPHGREALQAGSPAASLAETTSSQRSYTTRSHNLRGRGERSGTPPDAPRIGDRRDGDRDWYSPAQRPPPWADEVDVPTPAQVAAVYRDLRKGREDAKDEPGAAYFYYGEMEMRRHATSAVWEKLILWLYWLLSGYGLRAKRALVALATVILVAGVAFAFWGFAETEEPGVRAVAVDDAGAPVYEVHEPERPAGLHELPSAIRFSAQSTAALLRSPDDEIPLTAEGEWLHLALRLIGPLLLGLAILAIRGRVKR